MRVPIRFSFPNRLPVRSKAASRGIVGISAVCTVLGLCLVAASPLLISGCGSGGSSGGGGSMGLGRAAQLIGAYKSTQTLPNGATEELILDFAPGSAFETLAGNYTRRVLSARPIGGNDYLTFESGTLTGNILANGNLHVVFTPDAEVRSRAVAGEAEYSIGTNGRTIADVISQAVFSAFQQAIQTFRTNSVAGNWTGIPDGSQSAGGIILNDPRTDTSIGPVAPISIQYTATNTLQTQYTAAVTLTGPSGSYTATGVQARLYSQYDASLPDNFGGISKLDANQFYLIGRGSLPATAPVIPIPGTPISVPLANRAFLFEAGVTPPDSSGRAQLGTLFVKFDTSDPLYPLLGFAGIHPEATSGYVKIGYFLVSSASASTPTPTPTPTPGGQPSVGQIQFSNVSSPTNAVTTKITDTDAQANFSGNILNAVLTEKNGHSTVERNLFMEFYAPDQASISLNKTFTISDSTPTAAGQVRVSYIETSGQQKFWHGQSGTIKVIAHDSQTTTFRIYGAAMAPFLNGGGGTQPVGTFTIDAAGKF